ncbi:MAG: hypothetical protein SOT60_08600 [Bilifractor sp.]|nr:hypothetical protein [Lachnospiraceae bacterium]MDY2837980.1 hypothetical protein [Bilifractor sp.]
MDQDTYEQLMRVQISLDELKEKMDYLIDELDELKNININDQAEKSDQDSSEQLCGGAQAGEAQNRNRKQSKKDTKEQLRKSSLKIGELEPMRVQCVTRNVLLEFEMMNYNRRYLAGVCMKGNHHEGK